MSDTNDTAGQRLDAKVTELQQAWAELQPQLQAKRQELGDQIGALVDSFQARIDGIRN